MCKNSNNRKQKKTPQKSEMLISCDVCLCVFMIDVIVQICRYINDLNLFNFRNRFMLFSSEI